MYEICKFVYGCFDHLRKFVLIVLDPFIILEIICCKFCQIFFFGIGDVFYAVGLIYEIYTAKAMVAVGAIVKEI